MTLTTTCPSCETSFRIVPDQLKLRRGLVRCGACHTVFSATDFLHHIGETPLEHGFDATPVTVAEGLPEPAAEPVAEPIAEPIAEAIAEAEPEAEAEQEAEALSDPQYEDAIDFFATGSERRFGWMPRTWSARALGLLLLLGLAAQLGLGGRDWIAARYPQTRPLLEVLGRPLGLTIQLPRRLEAVTIEAELVSVEPPGSYRLNALLRSRADTALQWPAIELTLTDATGAIVTRRVLRASDYIANPTVVAQGLPAGSERTLRVGLEFSGPAPTGYAAQLFYP